MSQYLLDTNICIHWSKDEFGLRQKIKQVGVENCFLSELTIAELIYGIAKSAPSKQAANRHSLDMLRRLFADRILLVGSGFEVYGLEKVRLRAAGRPVDDLDLLIGCTAVAHGLTLVTRNTRHFAGLANLPLENWIDNP
jgi:tRNA(fMet)-specific endonuclease VapC